MEEDTACVPLHVNTVQELSQIRPLTEETYDAVATVSKVYPFRVSRHYLGLADLTRRSCPIAAQFLPSLAELDDLGATDPLAEGSISATPILLKRYPGRAVMLAASDCAMYCRFCNRKRLVGRGWEVQALWDEAFTFLEQDSETTEVILSGGDPFTLSGDAFGYLLGRLRAIGHIDTVRISTRMPVVCPQAVGEAQLKALKAGSPFWVVLHINHPWEISPQFIEVTRRLREAGNPLVSQTVLLRGVNDCSHVLRKLFSGLVRLGVKSYYLFQLDEVRGGQHFKVRIEEGLRIMDELRATASGLAIPSYVVDMTGGAGKIAAERMAGARGEATRSPVPGLTAVTGRYTDDGPESRCMECGICREAE